MAVLYSHERREAERRLQDPAMSVTATGTGLVPLDQRSPGASESSSSSLVPELAPALDPYAHAIASPSLAPLGPTDSSLDQSRDCDDEYMYTNAVPARVYLEQRGVVDEPDARFLTGEQVAEACMDVPPDGDCLYSALALGLAALVDSIVWSANSVRNEVAKYLELKGPMVAFDRVWSSDWYPRVTHERNVKRAKCRGFVVPSIEGDRATTFDDFVTSVRTPGMWAVWAVLLAARKAFPHVNIRVFRPIRTMPARGGVVTLDPIRQGVPVINLHFINNNHYQILLHDTEKELLRADVEDQLRQLVGATPSSTPRVQTTIPSYFNKRG